MSTWLDKPDADGLWFRQPRILSGSMTVCYVCGNRFRYVYYVHEGKACACAEEWLSIKDDAVWQRCELTPPEPYKPPTPPKVEWFIAYNGTRFVMQTQYVWVALDKDGVQCNCGHGKCLIYPDIKPLESPP